MDSETVSIPDVCSFAQLISLFFLLYYK